MPLLFWFVDLQTDIDLMSPRSCLQIAPTVEALVTCLDKFTVPHAYYDAMTHELAQPVGTQREDWKAVVQALLDVNGSCPGTLVPLSLQGLYTVEPFQGFCVLYETASRCGTYLKGWGFFIVPSSQRDISRNVHISAPHPGYDLGTVEQAAAVFEATGSRSLLVPGRTRTAFLSTSDCIVPTSPKQDYYKTDPAHNVKEPFFDASIAISNWQHRQPGGCPSSSCAFLQFHGKGSRTCHSDDIFLSSGLGNSSTSRSWYTDAIDRPIKRLQANLQLAFPSSWEISLPSDSNCPLTATKNVAGRYLNGIPISHVCSKATNSRLASGEFIHAEQATLPRDRKYYEAWTKAVKDTFEARCDSEKSENGAKMIIDPETGLCVGAVNGAVVVGSEGVSTIGEMGRMGNPLTLNQRSLWYMLLSFLNVP
ncbi:hypothetical protein GALMADRAFT_138224 [Galerina marginata CBS 339.88]|uniref:Uncharacterized protein n=1 Tax=Galerina marginata (strain CBS 339.88) TaxID=685588 RepID=A0A067TDW0_GALM3|nr:hypothetical protein GALMADRAFT_138224 [Galerina marginata CBS 339.88]